MLVGSLMRRVTRIWVCEARLGVTLFDSRVKLTSMGNIGEAKSVSQNQLLPCL